MLDLAECGPHIGTSEVNPDEARLVADFLIGEMLRLGCRFDLRLFVNKACPTTSNGRTTKRSPIGATW